MNNSVLKRISSFIIATAVTIPMFSGANVLAQENVDLAASVNPDDIVVEAVDELGNATSSESASSIRDSAYSKYYYNNLDKARPDKEIIVKGKDYVDSKDAELSVKQLEGKEALVWSNHVGSVTFKVDIPVSGVYNIKMSYFPMAGKNNSCDFALKIDGKEPYDVAGRISLNKIWVDEYPIRYDDRDNAMRPPQVESPRWITTSLKDYDGLFNDPLVFYLEAGEHELTIEADKANLAIEYIKFYNEKPLNSYDSLKPTKEQIDSTPSFYKRLQAEEVALKSSAVLYPTYDRTTYKTEPQHPTKMRYNTLGQGNWKKATQFVTFEVNIPEPGYYKIGIKGKQSQVRGFFSNRRIYINDVVQYKEADQVKFTYSTDFKTVVPKSEDGETMYFYFDKAGVNQIKLEAVPGAIGESMCRLDDIVYEINSYYRQILRITGPTPDTYNDYKIDKALVNIIDDFTKISKQLKEEKKIIEKIAGSGGTEAVALEKMAIILDKCIDKPSRIPTLLRSIKDNITGLSAWMRDFRDQPLELDYIEVASADKEFKSTKKNFFKNFVFGVRSFIGSFTEDYTKLSDDDEEALNVWIGLGRDQAQVVKEMTDSYFVPEYDIPVAINLVQGGIVEAILAGKGPDVSLFTGGDFPISLAARDCTVDLSQFPDFDEVKQRFNEDLTTLFSYEGGVYGLPISQNFPMLFYRTDVLKDFGFDNPPKTWDELIDMLPVLQKGYMEIGLSVTSANTGAVIDAGNTFALMMLQSGTPYYNEKQDKTMLDDPKAVDAFEKWVKFYTTYKFQQSYDAFSRFRTGEMPLLIQNYTFYNQLTVTAPEINGLWGFAPVPGTLREDGTISNAANSASTGALIFKTVENKENAWEFVKWFTSKDIQSRYGTTIEALMGPMGRYDTANKEALSDLSWSTKELELITYQRDQLQEVPIIPASYAVTRNIMNAFRAAVNSNMNPREILLEYNRDINAEIIRKRNELGID